MTGPGLVSSSVPVRGQVDAVRPAELCLEGGGRRADAPPQGDNPPADGGSRDCSCATIGDSLVRCQFFFGVSDRWVAVAAVGADEVGSS